MVDRQTAKFNSPPKFPAIENHINLTSHKIKFILRTNPMVSKEDDVDNTRVNESEEVM